MYDVFLSHSHQDAELVERLAVHLEDRERFRVWLDKWVLVPGKPWQPEIARGLNEAKSCVVCIGARTPRGWFEQEIQNALNRQTQDESFRVIPLLLPGAQKVDVNQFLQLRTWVDLTEGLEDRRNFHLLIAGIRGVAPGRGPEALNNNGEQDPVRQKLIQLRQYLSEELIDKEVAYDVQRKLLTQHLLGQVQQ